MIEAPTLKTITSIRHGFFTRNDGHSVGLYQSLNCGLGSNDDRESVFKNRAVCAAALGVDAGSLVTVHQEHTSDIIAVSSPWQPESAPVADGLVTKTPGLAIAVLAADCTPVLFAAPKAGVIGAAHAGWKGAISGVVENTIAAMKELGAKRDDIIAVVGPCIGAASYEVGPEFHERFISESPVNTRYFVSSSKAGHCYFDIGGYVLDRVLRAGVKSASRINADTYAESSQFFSYRRSCHMNEPDYGRQVSGIALAP